MHPSSSDVEGERTKGSEQMHPLRKMHPNGEFLLFGGEVEKHVVGKVDVASMKEMDECMRGVASRNKSDGCDARRVEWKDGSGAWSYDAVEEGSKGRTLDPPWTLDRSYSLEIACGTTSIPTMDLRHRCVDKRALC